MNIATELRRNASQIRKDGIENSEIHARTLEAVAGLLEKTGEATCGATRPVTEERAAGISGPLAAAATAQTLGECKAPLPRLVTDHQINGLNDAITIEPRGPVGPGGAHTQYVFLLRPNPQHPATRALFIDFQTKAINGPDDFDGFTNEAFLAMLIDRIKGFQGMPPVHPMPPGTPPGIEGARLAPNRPQFQCRENAIALTHLEEALHWLQHRSRDRERRGVDGKRAQ